MDILIESVTLIATPIPHSEPYSSRWNSNGPLYDAQNASCFYCNLYMTPQKHNSRSKTKCDRSSGYTCDHLFPKNLGFTLTGNKVLACYSCNHSKGNTLPTLSQIKKAHILYQNLGRVFVVESIPVDYLI